MAQGNTHNRNNFALDGNELSTFLSELDDVWALDMVKTPAPITSLSSRIKNQKPRRSRRTEIQSVRREITKLEVELQVLQEKFEFCKSLKTIGSNCDQDRSLTARRERAILRKRVDANVELIQRVSKLMHRQMETMSKPLQIDHRIMKIDNKARIYRVLQSCLDIRSARQLDAVVSRFNDISVGSELHSPRWNTFALGDKDVGVEFHDSVVMPFSSSFIIDTVSRNSTLNALDVSKNPMPLLWKADVSNQQINIRRIVSRSGHTFLLWEDVSCLQSDVNFPLISARGSGWAFTIPVANHSGELSVVHSGGFIRISAADGSSLSPTDVLVQEVVKYRQSLQRSRVGIVEDILICCRSKRM